MLGDPNFQRVTGKQKTKSMCHTEPCSPCLSQLEPEMGIFVNCFIEESLLDRIYQGIKEAGKSGKGHVSVDSDPPGCSGCYPRAIIAAPELPVFPEGQASLERRVQLHTFSKRELQAKGAFLRESPSGASSSTNRGRPLVQERELG